LTGLSNGPHSLAVRATDALDNLGPTATRNFTVAVPAPLTAPDTRIDRVAKKGKVATVSFSATGGSGAATFACKLDARAFAPCSSPQKFKKLKPGRHRITVQATAGGLTDATPATATFKIKKPKKKKK
jgi:hypothetical protein